MKGRMKGRREREGGGMKGENEEVGESKGGGVVVEEVVGFKGELRKRGEEKRY